MTKEALIDLETAGNSLGRIMSAAFDLIAKNVKNISEYEVQQFIVGEFRRQNLRSASEPPIVAFGRNTQHVHYFPSQSHSDKLMPESLILIDVWARLNRPGAPFADITWMGYSGKKLDGRKLQTFQQVLTARDMAVDFIRREVVAKGMPPASEVDRIVQNYFKQEGVNDNFLHTTGHVLGFTAPHGRGLPISESNRKPLQIETGYTIEPGLYFENEFGVRSEIDFYITADREMKITTPIQDDIININL